MTLSRPLGRWSNSDAFQYCRENSEGNHYWRRIVWLSIWRLVPILPAHDLSQQSLIDLVLSLGGKYVTNGTTPSLLPCAAGRWQGETEVQMCRPPAALTIDWGRSLQKQLLVLMILVLEEQRQEYCFANRPTNVAMLSDRTGALQPIVIISYKREARK